MTKGAEPNNEANPIIFLSKALVGKKSSRLSKDVLRTSRPSKSIIHHQTISIPANLSSFHRRCSISSSDVHIFRPLLHSASVSLNLMSSSSLSSSSHFLHSSTVNNRSLS
ncbi:hypothetical protein RYX36_010847 [Vicia faba]